jgi:lysyl-tRNA synthetase class 1
VHWVDQHGIEGKADLRTADGKLPWRLDWPAKWQQIGVTCEPFGKDHAAAGGSYDTGKEIAKLLGYEAPMSMPYEWISLKGQGAMSSSKGITLSARQLLDIVPPEIMRYLIARTKPKRAIDFDTGEGLISMADEFERLGNSIPSLQEKLNSEETMKKRQRDQIEDTLAFWKYSQVVAGDSTASGSGISFSHLSLVAQVKQEDAEVWRSLNQTHGIDEKQPSKVLQERLWRMRNWIAGDLFPDSSRVAIQEKVNTEWVNSLGEDQIAYLQRLSESTTILENTESAINQWIRNTAQDCKLETKVAFNTLYNLYLGKDKGPRLAALLSALGKEQIIAPLTSVLNNLG